MSVEEQSTPPPHEETSTNEPADSHTEVQPPMEPPPAKIENSSTSSGQPQKTTIHIANLSSATSEETLRIMFSPFGDVSSVRIPRNRETGIIKGYGFIELSNEEAAKAAIAAINNTSIDGHTVVLELSKPRPEWKPRRTYGEPSTRRSSGYDDRGSSYDRGYGERNSYSSYNSDRSYSRGSDRGYDRGYDRDRGRSYERTYDRGYDRGDRDSYDRSERNYDRGYSHSERDIGYNSDAPPRRYKYDN